MPIKVPGLSDRREDIPELVRYFVQAISVASGLAPRRIGEDAMAVLQSYDWQGNVRQLRNNIERLMILVGGDADTIITADMLPDEIISPVPLSPNGAGGEHLMSLPLRDAREIFEREYLLAQVNRFGGNISRTAEFVGMERSALHRKLRALGVNSTEEGRLCARLSRRKQRFGLSGPLRDASQSRLMCMWPEGGRMSGANKTRKRGPKGRGSPWQQNARRVCRIRFSIMFVSKRRR